MNTRTNQIDSDSSERKYVHLSNVCYRALKFVTRLEYEYTQLAVDLFCENVTLVHCLVLVCNNVSLFFLYLKECVVILKFGSTVSCGLTTETRLTRHKPIA